MFTDRSARFRSTRYTYSVGIGLDHEGEKDNLVEWLKKGLFHNTYRLLNTDLDGADGLLAVLLKMCMQRYCTVDYVARILSADQWYSSVDQEGQAAMELRSRARAHVIKEFYRAQDDLGWIRDLVIDRGKRLTGHEKFNGIALPRLTSCSRWTKKSLPRKWIFTIFLLQA